jgi:hypothetical protein
MMSIGNSSGEEYKFRSQVQRRQFPQDRKVKKKVGQREEEGAMLTSAGRHGDVYFTQKP